MIDFSSFMLFTNYNFPSNDLQGVATEIAMGRQTKNRIWKKRGWSCYHSLFWKTTKKPKKKSKVCEKSDFGSRSRLRVGKVLAPHNARPKRLPLIKCAKDVVFKIFIFPQK